MTGDLIKMDKSVLK